MGYRFLGFGGFMKMFRQVRILNLTGAMGTGKTLFGVALGYHLLRLGLVERAAFNLPVGFGAAPNPRFCYSLYDEAGIVFDNRMAFKDKELNQISSGLTFGLRKAGSYFVIPSFLEVDKRFRAGMRMWRTWAVGASAWHYVWEVGPEETEERRPGRNYWQGRVLFVNPKHFFGTYDTYFVPGRQLSVAFLRELLAVWEQQVPVEYRGMVPGL